MARWRLSKDKTVYENKYYHVSVNRKGLYSVYDKWYQDWQEPIAQYWTLAEAKDKADELEMIKIFS